MTITLTGGVLYFLQILKSHFECLSRLLDGEFFSPSLRMSTSTFKAPGAWYETFGKMMLHSKSSEVFKSQQCDIYAFRLCIAISYHFICVMFSSNDFSNIRKTQMFYTRYSAESFPEIFQYTGFPESFVCIYFKRCKF